MKYTNTLNNQAILHFIYIIYTPYNKFMPVDAELMMHPYSTYIDQS